MVLINEKERDLIMMKELRENIQNQSYLESPHGQLFPAEDILYNRQQEALEEAEHPLGIIGKMFQAKLEDENPDVALQQKFEGTFYRNAKDKEGQVLERIDTLYMKSLDESQAPESVLERIQHFQMLHQRAKEFILAEYN